MFAVMMGWSTWVRIVVVGHLITLLTASQNFLVVIKSDLLYDGSSNLGVLLQWQLLLVRLSDVLLVVCISNS